MPPRALSLLHMVAILLKTRRVSFFVSLRSFSKLGIADSIRKVARRQVSVMSPPPSSSWRMFTGTPIGPKDKKNEDTSVFRAAWDNSWATLSSWEPCAMAIRRAASAVTIRSAAVRKLFRSDILPIRSSASPKHSGAISISQSIALFGRLCLTRVVTTPDLLAIRERIKTIVVEQRVTAPAFLLDISESSKHYSPKEADTSPRLHPLPPTFDVRHPQLARSVE